MAHEFTPARPHVFDSFWIGGFEAATHINGGRKRLDLMTATQHDLQVDHDYELLKSVGIRTVRDAVRWHLIERDGVFDFSSLAPMVVAAERHGMQVLWTLLHYGLPDDVDVFSSEFPERFARFSGEVARFIQSHSKRLPFYTPVNEISFFSWAAGQVGWFHPFKTGQGGELKRQLVKGAIASCDAIWKVDRRARVVHVDPVIHVVPPVMRPDLTEAAERQRLSQFESWDMLAGICAPELGGHPRYLDVMGVNFYHSNQWEYPDVRLRWEDTPRDARWRPLHKILAEVFDRYRRPLFIGETSHVGVGRADWIREIAAELWSAHDSGVPLEGICLFPIIDRMDWNDESHWHNSGLWDLVEREGGVLERVLNQEYAEALRHSQALLARCGWGDLTQHDAHEVPPAGGLEVDAAALDVFPVQID
jgi:beta-glucosidase/6-phospho-beta-glucosidase/beta-galactosidase